MKTSEINDHFHMVARAGRAIGGSEHDHDLLYSLLAHVHSVSFDPLDLEDITTYVQFMPLTVAIGNYNANFYAAELGISIPGGGDQFLTFNWQPPEWLIRYCEVNSKVITATTMQFHWFDTVSADYITRLILRHGEFDTNTVNTKYDSGTNLGIGTTGQVETTINFTDFVVRKGDWINFFVQVSQAAGNTIRCKMVEVTYTF